MSIALLVLNPGLSAYVPILQHAGVVISESFVLLHVVSAGKLLFSRLTRFFLKQDSEERAHPSPVGSEYLF